MNIKDIELGRIFDQFPSATNLEQILTLVNEKVASGGTGGATTVNVGTTTTGAAGTNASVANSGTETAVVLNFTIPRGATGTAGAKGDKGDAGANGTNGTNGTNAANPIFTVGTVTQGATPSVTVTGTYPNLALNFVLVKGDKGNTGAAGASASDGLTIFSWTGNQSISSLSEQNITTLLQESEDSIGFTKVGDSIKFEARGATEQTNIGVRVRVTGTILGGATTDRFYQAQLRRADGTTVLENLNLVKTSGTNVANASAYFATYSKGSIDPFVINGFQIWIINGDDGTLQMTAVNITIYASAKP